MSELPVDVVRVFIDERGDHGNPLGVVEASPATAGREQEIAARLGYAETVFVEPLRDGVGAMRIFTPGVELPFAGHPSVGAAWWRRSRGEAVRALRVPAGEVPVAVEGELTWITGRAAWAPEFALDQLASPGDVEGLDAAAVADPSGANLYPWAWIDEPRGAVRSRMFAPAMGIAEDEATGAAAVRLTAALGRDLDITQGRGSRLVTRVDGELVHLGGRVVAEPPVSLALD